MRKCLLPLLVSSNLAAASLRGRGGRDEERYGGDGPVETKRRLGRVDVSPYADPDLALQGESLAACDSIVAEAGWILRDLIISEEDGEESDGGGSSSNSIDRNSYFEESFVCEQIDGTAYRVRGTEKQIQSLRVALNEGDFVSSEVTIPGVTVVEGVGALGQPSPGPEALLPAGTDFKFVASGRRRRKQLNGGGRRGLASYSGVKEVLVVRVTDSKGLQPDRPGSMSDNIFGTYGDKNNLKTQMKACSFGKLDIVPTEDCGKVKCDAPGVIDVTINISLKSANRNQIRNAASEAVRIKTGITLPGNYDHVMYVVEGCYNNCGYAAYAGGESNKCPVSNVCLCLF